MLTVVPFGGYNFYSEEDKKNLTAYMDSLENVDTIWTPNLHFFDFSVGARRRNGVESKLLGIFMKKTVFVCVFTVS